MLIIRFKIKKGHNIYEKKRFSLISIGKIIVIKFAKKG